jgi:hypothetical protein
MYAMLFALLTLVMVIPPAATAAVTAPSATRQKPSVNDCILFATIFTDQGRLLQGAEIRVHPVGKKKPAYQAYSDRRGEFAVRVPTVGEFEIEIRAEGFVSQTRKVTTIQGQKMDMVFHMVRPSPPVKQK